jgi:SAM-dependent methyltransferase
MDAQQLDLESGSFDAAIARLSLQFVPDLQRALGEVRRLLKPGGKLAGMTWSVTEQNPYRAIPQAIASRLAGRPFPEPGPGQWGLRDAAALGAAFRAAGFREVDVRAVPIAWRFRSLDEALKNAEASQPPLTRLLGMLGEADRAAAWTEIRQALERFSGPDGFEAPGEALIASGTA